jgi:tripartite-type tricarboxylate transporter receptor subunit TctC
MSRFSYIGALLAAIVLPSFAAADSYPDRPIRAIASQGPGGLSDVFMRALAEELTPVLGQSVVVENRVGAAGSIGARACADAEPDGYTICILNNESMVINPLIFKNMNFDPKTSLTHVVRLFYPNARIRGERFAECEDVRSARGASQVQAQDYELPDAIAFEGRVHGGL